MRKDGATANMNVDTSSRSTIEGDEEDMVEDCTRNNDPQINIVATAPRKI
jgi:hypothetical protein